MRQMSGKRGRGSGRGTRRIVSRAELAEIAAAAAQAAHAELQSTHAHTRNTRQSTGCPLRSHRADTIDAAVGGHAFAPTSVTPQHAHGAVRAAAAASRPAMSAARAHQVEHPGAEDATVNCGSLAGRWQPSDCNCVACSSWTPSDDATALIHSRTRRDPLPPGLNQCVIEETAQLDETQLRRHRRWQIRQVAIRAVFFQRKHTE